LYCSVLVPDTSSDIQQSYVAESRQPCKSTADYHYSWMMMLMMCKDDLKSHERDSRFTTWTLKNEQ